MRGFVGIFAGSTSVKVSAFACEPVSRDVTIDGDTRLDVNVAYRSTFTLSGLVSEVTPNGLAPVADVRVYDSYFHAEVTTDTNGVYRFEGPFGGLSDSFGFTKEGYQTATRDVTINGNTRIDVQLVRR